MASVTDNLIYKCFGIPVEWIKKNLLRDDLNNTYNNLNKKYGEKWDSDKANAFQHAYQSALLAYDHNENVSLGYGLFVEFATWTNDNVNDANKDMINNKTGILIAKEAKEKNISKDDLAEIIYKKIKNNEDGIIIDPNDAPIIYNSRNDILNDFIENLSSNMFKNLPILSYLSRDIDMPENMINDLYDQYNGYRGKFNSAGDCECTPKDPIIFDLNNDGVLETTDINNGIYFDHENDGFAESSAWVGDNDGILVIDSNNNGDIDNGSELLTAETLASFDTNEDGIIDENDTNFANLKILKGDGTLMTLTEAGITSINLNTTSTEITDENGNQQFASGTYTKSDGTTGTFGEFLVKTETSNSIATEWLDETDEISDLPDISGRGNIYSLHQAMLRDESGELVA